MGTKRGGGGVGEGRRGGVGESVSADLNVNVKVTHREVLPGVCSPRLLPRLSSVHRLNGIQEQVLQL